MKLSARKTMIALGTAVSLSLAPVVAPTVAPMAVAASVSESNYRSQYDSVPNDIADIKTMIENFKAKQASDKYKGAAEDPEFTDATLKIDSAQRLLDDASADYETLSAKTGGKTYSKDNAALLRSITDRLSDSKTRVNEARGALNRVFVCDTKGKSESDGEGSSDLSSGDSSDSLSSAVGSAGNTVVVKDGKKYCKSKTDAMVERLSSFAKTLGVILSVITAVAALNSAVTKNNPFAPKK